MVNEPSDLTEDSIDRNKSIAADIQSHTLILNMDHVDDFNMVDDDGDGIDEPNNESGLEAPDYTPLSATSSSVDEEEAGDLFVMNVDYADRALLLLEEEYRQCIQATGAVESSTSPASTWNAMSNNLLENDNAFETSGSEGVIDNSAMSNNNLHC
jgi:hypothetical protein